MCTKSSRGARRPSAALSLAGCLLVISGCAARRSSLQVTSYGDPFFPETYRITLDRCAYRVASDGDTHIVAYAAHQPEDAKRAPIEQMLHVHMFWKPWPGKTSDDPTATDALIGYAIRTDRGVTAYRGSGFVYVREPLFGDERIVQIESGRLHPVSRSNGETALLGDSRVVGELRARADPALVMDIARRVDQALAGEVSGSRLTGATVGSQTRP
jgi:hypothetical protein